MALHRIQDDIIRRALDFFGLRGVVQHDYESTVLPVVQIAKLPQPVVLRIVSGPLTSGTDLMRVPDNETWEPILFSGEITQTIGTTAPRLTLNALQAGGYFFDLEASYASQTLAASRVLSFTTGVNQTTAVYCSFNDGILLAPGVSLQFLQTGGDGTILMFGTSFLMYRRLGERLVAQQ